MTDTHSGPALLRLLTWLSPAFPVGAFSYSHGLESAVADGLVTDGEQLFEWIETLVESGSGWNDAVLLCESWRRARDGGELTEPAYLAEALAGSAERHMESRLQGAAFLTAAANWPHPAAARLPERCPYPVAVGTICGVHGIACADAAGAYLHAFASNLIQAAIRLGVVGQRDATAVLARLEPVILATANRAARSGLDDLGTATILSEIAAMRHETQHTRLFRS
ncbi:urease accessory protein UreF [Mesorhizobium xinjiangense]|uniref:urease accessory protein UreF n=1 Tax=Mesorhizobium xinjiangense TaxID=2678685 RepID=UPI0012ED91DB